MMMMIMICCPKDSEENGMLRSECEVDQGSDTNWKRWIEYDMCCVFKCMKLIAKYLFLARILFLGGHLRLG